MIQKIKRILEEHQGTAFPLVIAVVLALLLLFVVSASTSACKSSLRGYGRHCRME